MTTYREQRGEYLIEASAFRLPSSRWQPRLTMTRLAHPGVLAKCQSFPGLTPDFETAKGAARFAADLGLRLAEERSSRLRI
ncbi:MAG: hypothetical protein AB1452_05500 [Pseudomonadota bacterium]